MARRLEVAPPPAAACAGRTGGRPPPCPLGVWRPVNIIFTVLLAFAGSVVPFTPGKLTPVLAAQSISFQQLFPAAAVDNGKQRVNVRQVARMVDVRSPLYDILANGAFRGAAGQLGMKGRLFRGVGPLRYNVNPEIQASFKKITTTCAAGGAAGSAAGAGGGGDGAGGGGGGNADGASTMVVASVDFVFQLCNLLGAYSGAGGLSASSGSSLVPTPLGTATCQKIATTVVAACKRAHATNSAEVRELCAPRQFYMYTELGGPNPGITHAEAARVPLGQILQVHVPSTWARHRAGPAPHNQICFFPTGHSDHKQGAEFAQMAERLAKHTSQGRSFLKADQRLTLGVALGKHLTRDPVVDKDVHPVAFRSAVQYVRKIIFATLSDRDDTCATDNGAPSAERRAEKVVDHLRYYLRSRVWRLDYKTSPCEATDELEAFIVESSATLYALTRMGSNTYNIVRANSRMDAALQKSLGLKSPYLLASYKKMLVYLNDNFKKDWEEESYQLQARYTKGGHVVHGGAMSSLRATKNILTNEASLAVVDKYHDKDLMRNFLVLESVKFDDDSATWDTSKIRWPTNLDYYTDEQREDVCGHSNLRGLSALCRPDGYLSNARVALSAPAGTPADTLGYVMLLQVPPTLWGYFQKVHGEDPNPGAGMPSATVDIAMQLKSTFKARVVYNWKERCDIDGTHISKRAHTGKGEASYTNEICNSGGWKRNTRLHNEMSYVTVNTVVKGSDKLSLWRQYWNSAGLRALRRQEEVTVVYDRNGRPWVKGTRYILDTKAAQSFCGMGGAVGNTRNLMNDHTKRDDTISQTDPAKASNPYKWEELQCSGSHHFEMAGLYDKCSRDMRLVLGAEVVLSHANACIAAGKKTPRVTQDLITACKPLLLAARPKFKKDGSNLAARKYNGIQAWRVDGTSERGNTLRRHLIATFTCDSTGTTWATANLTPLPQTAGTIEETTAEEEVATAADNTNAVGLGDDAAAEVPAAAAYGEDPAATAAAARLAAKTLRWPMPAKCFADEGTFVWEDSSERAWAAFVPRPDSPMWSKLENALSTFKDTDPTLLHVGEGKTSGTCNVGGGGTTALCAGPTTEAACKLQSAGTCTVSEGGTNAACAAATTVMACVGASSGTCAVTAGGTNAACAAATTADSCAAASGGGNAASACVFTAEADNACVFAPRVADACVFTPDSRTPDEISTELRTRALQRCQQDKTRRKTDMKNLDALIKATQALVDVATAEMMRERKVDRFSLASTRAYEARKKARALLAKLKTERLAVGTTTGAPPASLCEMRDLLNAFETSDTCKTIPRTGISATLRDGADLVCNLQATTIETGKKGHAQLWKLVTSDAVMAKWNAWVRAKDFSDLGHLHGHHWLGHLNFFYPGECSLIDVMHTFFRVVGSTMWSVLIKLYQQLDLRCAIDKNGVSRMGTLASHLENANSGARLGKSKVYPGSKREAPTIVKQATSHVHNDLVYNLDWTIGLGMKQQSSGTLLPIKTPHASDQAFCDSELAAARGWSAVSKYIRVLHYFLMFSPDELREFGFDTRASAGLWLQKTISKMYKLAETLHPPRDLVKNGNIYKYSPFGTRSCTNLGHQIPKQYEKGVDHARENADGHERMQGPCRAAAAKTLSGMNNQGKCGPEQMLSNMDIAAALRRGDMKEADKWVKRAKKKMAAMYATLSVGEMRAAVDELTSMSVDEILDMPAGKTFKSASEMLRTDAGNLETLHQDMDEMLLVAPAPGERGVRDGDAPTPEELAAEEAEEAAEAAAGTAATNEETWETAQAEDAIPTTLGNDA